MTDAKHSPMATNERGVLDALRVQQLNLARSLREYGGQPFEDLAASAECTAGILSTHLLVCGRNDHDQETIRLLTEALEALGKVRPECECGWWHAYDCPHWDMTPCRPSAAWKSECADTCRQARAALDRVQEPQS